MTEARKAGPQTWTIQGGGVLGPDGLVDSDLIIADGEIADRAEAGAERFDASGLMVLPGIVDIHGDAFERQIMPRPKVGFGLDLALFESDRQLISNGITTAYHGLTVSWEPGLRSLDAARNFVESFETLRPRLACDTRLHLRWETFAFDAMAEVKTWLSQTPRPILAFNDHTTPLIEGAHMRAKLPQTAQRAGISESAYEELAGKIWSRRDQVSSAIAEMAEAAGAVGAVRLAHDERSPDERHFFRGLGAVASEFPMTLETARAAREAGEHVILGAPNVVRGGSHNGAIDATQCIADGLCSVLTSDYYYPTPLVAAFKLVSAGHLSLPAAWSLVSKNAAEAAGLEDRGELVPGRRADIVLVDTSGPLPRVAAVFVAGRKVYEAQ